MSQEESQPIRESVLRWVSVSVSEAEVEKRLGQESLWM